ncbi:putative reverse transcriptase domain-containing protein [Tanacetum coccineum]
MHQRRWIELFSDYKCEIHYHPGKANIVADALSRRERVKPKHVRTMAMTIQSGVKRMILVAQSEAFEEENTKIEMMHALDQLIGRKEDEGMYFIWVPLIGNVRTLIMDEAHASRYLAHPGANNTYHDLRDRLSRSSSGYDTNLVIVDRLTKSTHFLAIQGDYKMEKLARIYIYKIVVRHGVPVSIISDHDGRFTSRVLANITESLKDVIGYEYDLSSSNGWTNYHSSIRCASFEALYGRKCRSPVLWAEIGESRLIGPELVQEMTDNIVLIKEKLKAVRDRQRSYADNRRKLLEFEKYLANANLHVHLEEIKVDKTLRFVEEPVEIIDREVKSLKRSRIPIVKVHWNLKQGHEDFIKSKYPHFLVEQAIVESTK